MNDLSKLQQENYITRYQQTIDGEMLMVKESAQYRWFEYAGNAVQSLMKLSAPEQIVLPVYQSLLLFLLWNERPLKVLNLGLGGASIERTLATLADISLTSVDSSQAIIDMAKAYFNLPNAVQVVCQKAEQFIEQSTQQYDVIVCDLFIGERSPGFLLNQDFYAQLSNISHANSVLMVNLQADTDEQLLRTLLAVRDHFPYLALIEFDDYRNIVIVASSQPIPSKQWLQQRLVDYKQVTFSSLERAIHKMRYIPHAN